MLYVKGIWERGTFTIPDDTPDDRIQFKKDEYKREFGQLLEAQGFSVLEMTNPSPTTQKMKAEPGRKRYDVYARVIRKPEVIRFSVPDLAVPALQGQGFKLLD